MGPFGALYIKSNNHISGRTRKSDAIRDSHFAEMHTGGAMSSLHSCTVGPCETSVSPLPSPPSLTSPAPPPTLLHPLAPYCHLCLAPHQPTQRSPRRTIRHIRCWAVAQLAQKGVSVAFRPPSVPTRESAPVLPATQFCDLRLHKLAIPVLRAAYLVERRLPSRVSQPTPVSHVNTEHINV